MDARSKANFINAVVSGQENPCPNCNTLNEADAKFCASCGTPMIRKSEAAQAAPQEMPAEPVFTPVQEVAQEAPQEVPAFVPLKKVKMAQETQGSPTSAPAEEKKEDMAFEPLKKVQKDEVRSAFADGLPEWTIEPPQILVRRKRGR